MDNIDIELKDVRTLLGVATDNEIIEMISKKTFPIVGDFCVNIFNKGFINKVGNLKIYTHLFFHDDGDVGIWILQEEDGEFFCSFEISITYKDKHGNETDTLAFALVNDYEVANEKIWNKDIIYKHSVNIATMIMAIEYCLLNPKKILRPSMNTTHSISNKKRKSLYRNLKNVTITYTNKNDAKGHHRSPAFEFSVKGHWRTYKNGKKVWIRQHKRCEGKGMQTIHRYELLN